MENKNKRTEWGRQWVCMILVALLLLTSCGRKTDDGTGETTAATEVTETAAETTVETTEASEETTEPTEETKPEPHHVIATATMFTARCIEYSVRHFLPKLPARLIVGGGGSRNLALLQNLKVCLPECLVQANEDLGLSSDAKEAIAFAVLGNETLFEASNNVPGATGASHPTVMGKISF